MRKKRDEGTTLKDLQELIRSLGEGHKELQKALKAESEERKKRDEEQRKREAEREAERKKREAERKKREAERKKREAEREAERKKRDEEQRKREAEREAERKKREAEREVERKESEKKMKKLENLFTSQWGKLMESLVKGDLIPLLNDRNIHVNDIAKEREKHIGGETYEFDIIAIDGHEVVAVEVKTTMRLEDVMDFAEKMGKFKQIFPAYANDNVYGAMAYLKEDEGAAKKAEKCGFFVIRATGSSASIINPKEFMPKIF